MEPNTFDVIYIDDDPMMTELFSQYIGWKYANWQARAVNDPLRLWNEIRAGSAAARVWIIDLMMPDKNGCDIAEAVREKFGGAERIIGYTALDIDTLRGDPQYSQRLSLFSRIVRKNEGIAPLLALADDLLRQEQG